MGAAPSNRWEFLLNRDPFVASVGFAQDLVLLDGVSRGVRQPTLRLWQTTESGIVLPGDRGSELGARNVVARRLTSGADWTVEGDQSILWSVASRQSFDRTSLPDLICEWPLTTLRLIGLQASAHEDGSLRTPLGTVGYWGLASLTGASLVQGIVNYAAPAGSGGWPPDSENVRSQSGLPLPLIVDRFSRTARTLYLARESQLG